MLINIIYNIMLYNILQYSTLSLLLLSRRVPFATDLRAICKRHDVFVYCYLVLWLVQSNAISNGMPQIATLRYVSCLGFP